MAIKSLEGRESSNLQPDQPDQAGMNFMSLLYELMGRGNDTSLGEIRKAVEKKRTEGQEIDWPNLSLTNYMNEMRDLGIIDEENRRYFFVVNGRRMRKVGY